MTNATEMARVSAKGGFHLLWGLVISTIISAVGTIFIARLLGADNYGLYTIAITAPNLIAVFRDWGVATAMIKFTAQYCYEGSTSKVRSIFVSGLMFELLLGVILSVISFLLSIFLATLFNRPEIAPLIQISSFIVLMGALISTATAAFTGMEKMHLNSIMLVVQSVIKTGLIIGLILLGLGNIGAVTGFTASILVAGLTGLLLTWMMYRDLPKSMDGKLEILDPIRTMLKYGLPLSIGAILTVFLTQFYNYMMAIYVTDNAAIGNYSVASNFVVLITFFATPVTTMLFPAFSKIDHRKDWETLKNVFQYSVKYSSLMVVPVTAMIMALSQPAIETIFENQYTQAPLFLALSSLIYFYSALGNLSIPSLINGQGHTSFNLKLTILTVAFGFPIGFLLISQFGLIGLIVTSLTVGLPSSILSLRFVKKQYGLSLDWISSTKILFSSSAAGIFTFLFISQLPFRGLLNLIIGILIFILVFVPMILLTRTINRADLSSIQEIIAALGPLRGILNRMINLLGKIMSFFKIS